MSRLVSMEPGEGRIVGWAFLYLFAVFSSYSVLRPIRDEAGVAGGVENLSWLFTGTLLAMIAVNTPFAALVKRMPRKQFIALTYRFFELNLLVFLVLFQLASGTSNVWVGRAFFIWTSVFNLFVVSVFWAFMVDVFSSDQGKRLFGFIAAAATIGGLVGSSLTATLVSALGVPPLLLVSAVLIELGVQASQRLARHTAAFERTGEAAVAEAAPIGGSALSGLTHALSSPYLLNIAIYMLLYTVLSTFLYFQQAEIVDRSFASRAERTVFFANIEQLVQGLTVFLQFFVTGRVMRTAGVRLTLMFVPAITAVGFLLLGFMPTAAIVVGFTVLRRAGNFSFARPTREVLFTVVSREDKYKAKSFIDTVVYRLGDQVGAWASSLIAMGGFGPGAIAWAAVPLGLAWLGNAAWLGGRQEQISARADQQARDRGRAKIPAPVVAS